MSTDYVAINMSALKPAAENADIVNSNNSNTDQVDSGKRKRNRHHRHHHHSDSQNSDSYSDDSHHNHHHDHHHHRRGSDISTDSTTEEKHELTAASHSSGSTTRVRRNANDQQSVQRQARDLESAINDAVPLLETNGKPTTNKPPLAGPEIDDESDEVPNTDGYHPGVDDGFFPETATIGPRIGEPENPPVSNGGAENPKVPPTTIPPVPQNGIFPQPATPLPNFPYARGIMPGDTFMDRSGRPQVMPDVNAYQHKKTLAQGMMDLALFSANANQLRYVLESPSRHPYFYVSLFFISLSLIVQVAVGVGLVINSQYNVNNKEQICKANRINNFTVLGIFIITVVNVFISAFGVADSTSVVNST